MTTPWITPPLPGKTHILVPAHEHGVLHEGLLSRCHSHSRLELHGYRMAITPPNKSPRRSEKQQSSQTEGAHKQDKRRKETSQQDREQAAQAGKRKAIALDCEMVGIGASGNRDALAFLSAVDFITGEVLINNYVQPPERVKQWRSRVSGVTAAGMAAAVAARRALFGWESARQALWEFADDNTVLIGHTLNNDLRVLRIIHFKVVDSAILTGDLAFNPEPDARLRRIWGLKTLAKALLNRDIQTGRYGHNCLEDTFATRDVVIWCLKYPTQAAAWAENAKKDSTYA
ncbi:ribonuclease H-like domain-containing protein [Aspergillus pseudoustus]|uniref:Ribonuclease H-like domain-containing protein n=1 Tax=Aspergillus pseudoustus TaxID=1810923 RepID=A0ABR4KT75_9EURO